MHLQSRELGMTVIRIGGILQPAWARTSSAVVETTSKVANRLQSALILSHDAALAVSAFLTPVAVIALVFGMWRIGEDIGLTQEFVIFARFLLHSLALLLRSH